MQKCPLSLLTYLLHIGAYVSVSLQCCCIVMKCCDCCLIIRRCRCCMKQAVGSGTRWDNSASICPTTTFEPWWNLSASARAAKSHFKVELCACRLAVMMITATCAGSDVVFFYRRDALSTTKPTASEHRVSPLKDNMIRLFSLFTSVTFILLLLGETSRSSFRSFPELSWLA